MSDWRKVRAWLLRTKGGYVHEANMRRAADAIKAAYVAGGLTMLEFKSVEMSDKECFDHLRAIESGEVEP
jgi:hypothetical protein